MTAEDEKPFSVEEFTTNGGIVLPVICKWHEHDLVVKQLRVTEDETPSWRVWFVVASILLFQGTVVDKRFQASSDGSVAAINAFLVDVGCPCCANLALYKLVIRVLKKGLDHAVAVSKFETKDPEFQRWLEA